MAKVFPFKAVRPAKDKVHLVASRSVDTYSRIELEQKLKTNPYTFLHIINPDFKDGEKTEPGSKERLKKVKQQYHTCLNEGLLLQDSKPCYYIYRQTTSKNTYTGIIACASVDDYFEGVIKVHEQTLTAREEKLKEYLDACEFNAEPVLFSYPNQPEIDGVVEKYTNFEALYDFSTSDAIQHQLWVIEGQEDLNIIREAFKKLHAIYIADGHHRSASSALLGKSRREKANNPKGELLSDYYLGAFFPESELMIYDFNRFIHDIGNLTIEQLIGKLSEIFHIEIKQEVCKPKAYNNFSMYANGNWYSLTLKSPVNGEKAEDKLDAAILSKQVLAPIFNIKDLKTDPRISFIPGIKGMEALEKAVDKKKNGVAFALYPVTMDQLKNVANESGIMPPKSTWIEPKLRSGLTIYSLES